MQSRHRQIPRLLFGDRDAFVQRSFQALADQFSHVLPQGEFDSSARDSFLFKGNVLAVDSLVFNHAINSHLLATAGFNQHGLSLILAGQSSVTALSDRKSIANYGALISPPGTELRFETSLSQLTSSLHITFDLDRLNRVSTAMQGGEGVQVFADHLKQVRLSHGKIDLRRQFTLLAQQIDGFGGNAQLLRAAGFDDQVYRLLAITLLPEVFLKEHLSHAENRALQRPDALNAFERYVESHLQEPVSLTEIEILLGVSARALQYACMKRHGCSPSVYIRNKKLDHAHALLLQRRDGVKLAELAAQLYFSSQSQFARYFRERFGIRPSDLVREAEAAT